MKRLLRSLSWIVGISLVVLLVLGLALYGFTRTERFRTIAREQIVSAASGAMRGDLRIGAMEGSPWSEIVLRDVALLDGEEVIAGIRRVVLRHSLAELFSGELRIEEVVVEDPVVRLRQGTDGSWNLLRAVESTAPAAPEPAPEAGEGGGLPIPVTLDSFRLGEGEVVVAPAGAPTIHVRRARLVASLGLTAAGTVVRLESLSFDVDVPERPHVGVEAAATWDDREGRGRVSIGHVRVSTEKSRLELAGSVGVDPARQPTDLRLIVEPLAAADLEAFVPGLGLRPDVTGRIDVAGPPEALRAEGSLTAGKATARLDATADLTPDAPVWRASFEAADVEPASLLDREDLAGRIRFDLEGAGRGGSLADLAATATLSADGLGVAGRKIGAVDLDVTLADRKVEAAARVDPGDGTATLESSVELAGEERWTLDLDASALRIGTLAGFGDARPGNLNLAAEGRGSGLSPERMSGSLRVDVRPSRVAGVEVGSGQVELDIEPSTATGRVRLTGLALGETKIAEAALDVDARDLASEAPRVAAELDLGMVDAGVELDRVRLETKSTLDEKMTTDVALDVGDRGGGTHALRVTVERAGDALRVGIGRFDLDLPGGVWTLAKPAMIVQTGDRVAIDGLRLVSGARSFSLRGEAGASGEQDLALALDDLDLAAFRKLVPRRVSPAGVVMLRLNLGGSAAAPVIDAALDARGLAASGIRAEALTGKLHYAGDLAEAELRLRQDASHRLEATGKAPIQVRWAPELEIQPSDASGLPFDVRIHSAGLDVGALVPDSDRSLKEAAGTLALDVTITGTAREPVPAGTVSLREGRVRLVDLGVTLEDVVGDLSLTREALRVERFTARAGDEGTAAIEGRVTLADLVPREVEARVRLEEWPAIRTRQYEARIATALDARGPLDALVVSGTVDVLDATLRPDLAFLAAQPPERDRTIRLVGTGAPKPKPRREPDDAPAAAGTVNAFEGLKLDVDVRIDRNTWVKQEGTAIELRGELEIEKARLGDVRVSGRVETVRGWARFQGKRFTVTRGEILLTGGQTIDPRLDVVAEHRTGGYVVEILVSGDASKPKLEFRSAPALEQADILSVLLFGRPTSELSEGEQSSLGESAASLAASFAVSEVTQEVSRALGIESLGVQIQEVSTERVAVGAYVTDRTFVSVSQDVGGEKGREVSLEYQLTPRWSVVGTTESTGDSGGDVFWKKRY